MASGSISERGERTGDANRSRACGLQLSGRPTWAAATGLVPFGSYRRLVEGREELDVVERPGPAALRTAKTNKRSECHDGSARINGPIGEERYGGT
jgi:hypothetical protein